MKSDASLSRRRSTLWLGLFWILVGCGHSPATPMKSSAPKARAVPVPVGIQARGKIRHVVLIIQENRSFDNIFGGFTSPLTGQPEPFPGADSTFPDWVVASLQPGSYKIPPANGIYASHNAWQCLHLAASPFSPLAWQSLASQGSASCPNYPAGEAFTTRPFWYLQPQYSTVYRDIAAKYVLGDYFFAITTTSSFPAHQYLVAAQSRDSDGDVVDDQPSPGDCSNTGPTTTLPLLAPSGYSTTTGGGYGGHCYNNQTLADRFPVDSCKQADGLPPPGQKGAPCPWKHFVTSQTSGVFDGFINIQKWYKLTPQWPTSQRDLKRCIDGVLPGCSADSHGETLPELIWVKPPCTALSDHPGSSPNGQQWVGWVINQIGASPNWGSTAIFVLWDDWGGFFDHVVPPPPRKNANGVADPLGGGVRMPLLVISPWGNNQVVAHTYADFGSILKFVEDLYDLHPPLSDTVDGDAPDLSVFFNFNKPMPDPFRAISIQSSFDPVTACESATDIPNIIDGVPVRSMK
ncbi:MAG TPA: alkaline phosphatase family protein [Thermoanaerobaculia bacterium]|nr:alkaline phosphatase family protein [Thermoanaerobaculia bacterium]